MPRHILIDLYFSLIHSNLAYMIEIYGSADKTVLLRLEGMQRRVLKLIFNLPRMTPTLDLYRRVKDYNIVQGSVFFAYWSFCV